MAAERNRNFRRIGLQFAFWAVLGLLLLTILQNFVNISQTSQLSAYGDDWNDMSAFREDINSMGIETKSLVSSPLLLADIEDPRNTTYIVAGVERDTLSFPQFDEDGFITIATEDGYSPSEIDAIVEFVDSGGTVIVLEDFGYAGSIGEARTVYVILDINCMTPITFLNSTGTTSGCVFRPIPAAWKEPLLPHQQSRSMSVGHPMSEPTLVLN